MLNSLRLLNFLQQSIKYFFFIFTFCLWIRPTISSYLFLNVLGQFKLSELPFSHTIFGPPNRLFRQHDALVTLALHGNIHCVSKKCPTLWLSISLSNIDRFSKFFTGTLCGQVAVVLLLNIPPHLNLSLIHIWRCRRIERCRSRWSPYH